LGNIAGNPVREDIDEIGSMVGIDMVFNVILDERNRVVRAVAGHWFHAHREGVRFARKVFEVAPRFLADVVIASPGGYPRDMDVYQAQKSLSTSEIVCKPGGVIILVAECSQGLGNTEFEKTMGRFTTPAEVVEHFKNARFKMGLHKAYLWAKTLIRNRVVVVSDKLGDRQAEILKVERACTIEEAMEISSKYTRIEKVIVIPRATSIVPVV
jgi:nickel-dependent lactate racemase